MLRGEIDFVDFETIRGWAQDQSRPDQPLSLIVTDNDALIGYVLANRYRPDLETAGIGSGRHAFDFTFPRTLSPFEQHVVRVRYEADGRDISKSPITLKALQSFDAAAQAAVAGILAQYGSHEDTARKIDFLARRIEELLQQRADHESLRLRRKQYRHFVQRWQRRLLQDEALLGPTAAPDPYPRALVVDDRVPQLDRDAGSNAILSHIRSLQRLGYQVTFAAAAEFSGDGAGTDALDAR
jgi:hypothetical protein